MRSSERLTYMPGDLLEVKLKRGQMFTVLNEDGHICELRDGMGLIVTHVSVDDSSNAEVHVMVLVMNGVRRVSFYDSDRIQVYVTLLERAP